MSIITKFKLMIFIAITSLLGCNNEYSNNLLQVRSIDTDWKYTEVEGSHRGNAKVPGVIQTDLLANKQINDPFYRTKEEELQWIDKKDWIYTTNFQISEEELQKDNMILRFMGLDTYADVYLNDSLILQADNMFRQWNSDIKAFAKKGENELKIYFHSPIKKGLKLLEASPYGYPADNDQSERGGVGNKKLSVFTRKAAYHYGWDWGPRFVTVGIWRPIYFETWNNIRITNIYIEQKQINKDIAKLNAKVLINSGLSDKFLLIITDKNTHKVYAEQSININGNDNEVNIAFDINNPQLWWCQGLGNANMYDFEINIKHGDKIIAQETVSIGLRSLKLIREKDKDGESFLFELNGIRVFAKGANYIPNDSFLPRVSKKDYKKVIADAVDANMNMLRVWGGGIYENDEFYNLCDQNGIMVWQDFMFACSMYPGNAEFLSSVKAEAIDNLTRLRNHPCIALWCGNNEINAAWGYDSNTGWGWKERYTKPQQEEMQKAYMDIFHNILPEVVKKYTFDDDYWPSSPQAGYDYKQHAGDKNTSGDMHYWGVWHGLHPFENFNTYKARFMSEYGFQSFPDFETVQTYTISEDYDIESKVMTAHQRSGIGNLRIKEYMQADYKLPTDFKNFLYLSQVLQAKGIKQAIEAHRRTMPYCMGSLYWQINDCWPVASWSSTDYYHKWKAVHYAVKHAYEETIVSGFINKNNELQTYVVSDKLSNIKAELAITVLNFNGNTINKIVKSVEAKANNSTLVDSQTLKTLTKGVNLNDLVIFIQLSNNEGVNVKNYVYPSKPKEQKLPKPNIKLVLSQENGKIFVSVSTDKLARDVYLNIAGNDEYFSDNYFDLLANETRKIQLIGNQAITVLIEKQKITVNDIDVTHLAMMQ